ncbi:soluble scavenger receptor cysteine-rich domain-containing protein SSC5D-like isoform X2 [Hyperolius riggenbachi]
MTPFLLFIFLLQSAAAIPMPFPYRGSNSEEGQPYGPYNHLNLQMPPLGPMYGYGLPNYSQLVQMQQALSRKPVPWQPQLPQTNKETPAYQPPGHQMQQQFPRQPSLPLPQPNYQHVTKQPLQLPTAPDLQIPQMFPPFANPMNPFWPQDLKMKQLLMLAVLFMAVSCRPPKRHHHGHGPPPMRRPGSFPGLRPPLIFPPHFGHPPHNHPHRPYPPNKHPKPRPCPTIKILSTTLPVTTQSTTTAATTPTVQSTTTAAITTVTGQSTTTAAITTATEQSTTTAATTVTEQPTTTAATTVTVQPTTTAATTVTEQPTTTAATTVTVQPTTTAATTVTEQPTTTAATTVTVQPTTTVVATTVTEQPTTTVVATTVTEQSTEESTRNAETTIARGDSLRSVK